MVGFSWVVPRTFPLKFCKVRSKGSTLKLFEADSNNFIADINSNLYLVREKYRLLSKHRVYQKGCKETAIVSFLSCLYYSCESRNMINIVLSILWARRKTLDFHKGAKNVKIPHGTTLCRKKTIFGFFMVQVCKIVFRAQRASVLIILAQ